MDLWNLIKQIIFLKRSTCSEIFSFAQEENETGRAVLGASFDRFLFVCLAHFEFCCFALEEDKKVVGRQC